jgi:sulfite exporter TauE/SafE
VQICKWRIRRCGLPCCTLEGLCVYVCARASYVHCVGVCAVMYAAVSNVKPRSHSFLSHRRASEYEKSYSSMCQRAIPGGHSLDIFSIRFVIKYMHMCTCVCLQRKRERERGSGAGDNESQKKGVGKRCFGKGKHVCRKRFGCLCVCTHAHTHTYMLTGAVLGGGGELRTHARNSLLAAGQ